MADYYVSGTGSDSGDGTLTVPWRSLTRLNTAFASGQLGRGDRVFLERGATFFGRLLQPNNIDPALPGWLRIGAYGDGARPIVSGYKLLTAWTQHDADTWRADLSASGGYDGAQGMGDVGFLKVDGVIYGRRRTTLAGLAGQWDFYSEGTTLYVRSTANPTTLAGDIRCAVDGDGSNLRSGVELADLAIIGHGGHGVNAPGVSGSTRTRVLRCELAELGGSTLDGFGDGTVRYGNGLQAWIDTRDLYAEGNEIHDCYDVAFTAQGGDAGQTQTFTDITFRRNLAYRNSQSLEFWYGGNGPGFVNCLVDLNTCLFAGYGWGGEVRPETESRVHLLTFAWGTGAGLAVRRNVFYDGRAAYRYSSEDPAGIDTGRNVIAQRPGRLMSWQRAETIEQAAAWSAADGHETGSRYVVLADRAATTVSDADVTAAIAALDGIATAQVVATPTGVRALPIHGPWR